VSVLVECAHCGEFAELPSGHVNRSRAAGLRLYCGRACAGLGRRSGRTPEEKRAAKAAYDAAYRERNDRRAKKAAYHKRTYDPAKAREQREAKRDRMRVIQRAWYDDPANRESKRQYDEARRGMAYGDFADAHRLLIELEREIRRLTPDRYERAKARRGPYWMNRRSRGELRT